MLGRFWEARAPPNHCKKSKNREKIAFEAHWMFHGRLGKISGAFWKGFGKVFGRFWVDFGLICEPFGSILHWFFLIFNAF